MFEEISRCFFCFVCVFLVFESNVVCKELGCLNDNGELVDWYVMYKLPKIRSARWDYNIKKGLGYTLLQNGKWTLSTKPINDPTNPMFRTIQQVLDGGDHKEASYFMYNDEDPHTGRSGARYGHTKGVLGVNKESGFWLVHSIPRFPSHPDDGPIKYPRTGKLYGQSILCISFKQEDLQKILKTFMYTVPYIYARHVGEGIGDLPSDLSQIFNSDYLESYASPPWTYEAVIKSLHGEQEFKVFGKHKYWRNDLYDYFVAPELKTVLFTETWRRGAGGILDSNCGTKYPVMNIERINIRTASAPAIKFNSKSDHSKWAISERSQEHIVCIGDINRMHSQQKRGGGTVCLENMPVWNAYNNTVAITEDCPV